MGRWARAEVMGWGGSGGLLLCGKGALGCGLRVVGEVSLCGMWVGGWGDEEGWNLLDWGTAVLCRGKES